MKKLVTITILTLFCFNANAQYDSYQRNSDGTYAVGGCYDSYQRNPDGTYVCGGTYASYQRNPNGTYAVGWGKCLK